MGLARYGCHFARTQGKESDQFCGAWLISGNDTPFLVWGNVVGPPRICGLHDLAMDERKSRFFFSVNGAQYFMHELIGSWSSMCHSEIFLTPFSFIEVPQEFAFSTSLARVYLLSYNTR
jgi:hypothetical protein